MIIRLEPLLALIFLTLLNPAAFVCAEVPPKAPQSSIAQQLAPQLLQLDSMRGEFSQQRQISVLSLPLESSGTFHYTRSQGLIWETLTPLRNKVEISTRQGIEVEGGGGEPETIAASRLLAEIFLGVFSGNLSLVEDLFSIEEIPIEEQSSVDQWALRLTPKGRRLGDHIDAIDLRGSEHVEALSLREANGDTTQIDLRVLELR